MNLNGARGAAPTRYANEDETFNFIGAGVSTVVTGSTTTVTIPGVLGSAMINTQDEGTPLSSTVTTLNFVGTGVTATGSGATTTITIPSGGAPSGVAGGDLGGTFPNPTLAVILSAGTTGNATNTSQITRDTKGRITAATSVPITFPTTLPPNGAAGGDLAGSFPNPTLAPIVTAGTTGDATNSSQITRDVKGRITAAVSVPITFPTPVIVTQDEGTLLSSAVTTLNFVGAGVTASGSGATTTVTVAGAGTATITTKDEGTTLSAAVDTLNFVGTGVTASGAGATTTVTIPNLLATSVSLQRPGSDSPAINDILSWPIVLSDPGSMYNLGTSGSGGTAAITIPAAGGYLLNIRLAVNNGGSVALLKNGLEILRSGSGAATASSLSIHGVYFFASGDVLKTQVVTGSTNFSPAQSDFLWSVTRVV
jgi:hypothetical protein